MQVWLFGPYFLLIQLWSPKEVFSHIWRGVGYLISLAHLEASFVEIMMGKFIMSTLVTAGSLTILKVSKPTEADGSFIGSIFYFMATLCQLIARFMTFRLLFLTEMDMLTHFLLILAHIGLEFILKLIEPLQRYLLIPAKLPGQFSPNGKIFWQWAAATLKGLSEFQNKKFYATFYHLFKPKI